MLAVYIALHNNNTCVKLCIQNITLLITENTILDVYSKQYDSDL